MAELTVTGPGSNIDLSDRHVNKDPYPYLEQIRASGRVVWNSPSDAWLVSGFDDVKSILMNPAEFRQHSEMFEEIHGAVTLTGLDNPRHADVRNILGPYVSRTAAEGFEDLSYEVVDSHFRPVFERLHAGETVDIAPIFRTVATEFAARLIGVPAQDAPQFVAWANDMAGVFDLALSPDLPDAEQIRERAAVATRELTAYSTAALSERESVHEVTDLIGAIALTDVPISDVEKRAYITMLISAAQDTTATWAKSAALAFGLHPDQQQDVRENRDLLRQGLNEVIRLWAPVMAEYRIVRNPDTEFAGVALPQGDKVIVLIGAAHRDPTRWDNAGDFDIHRREQGNLGFGFGVHSCVGVNLARRLVTSFMNRLLDETPGYKVASSRDDLDYGHDSGVRGVTSLPLTL